MALPTHVVVTGQRCAGHMLMLLNVSNPSAFQKWIGRVGGSGGDSNQSTGKSWLKKSQRESDLKGYRLVDANCMTFWKRRNYGDSKEISGCKEVG